SDANAVAVADISLDRAHVHGFIPTAWYPTAVRALANGKLAILNGRGLRSYPNPGGPNPTKKAGPRVNGMVAEQYVGKIQTGTVAFLSAPTEEQLETYTSTVLAISPYADTKLDNAGIPPGGPITTRPGERSPIEH